ncbi:multicopper oxidase domain-containing protein [Intrasporangium flavum]|uniref:multicopper oxidase domain-containing protein n=1 Tax=Intrasporangium flavum TaxID=1428657 RepID=UPI0009F9A77D|nr:multicopper oxidase domain-containing protein [Intrasporangium flavum]
MASTSPRTPAGSLGRGGLPDVLMALVVGVTGGAWLSWLDLHSPAAAVSQGPVGHTVTVLAFTVPPVLAILPVTSASLRGRVGEPSAVLRCVIAVAVALAVGNQLRLVVLDDAPGGLPVLRLFGDAAVVLVVIVPGVVLMRMMQRAPLRPAGIRRRISRASRVFAAGFAAVAVVLVAPVAQASPAAPTAAGATGAAGCLDGGPVDRSFDVTAIDVNIPINRFGDHDPLGKMYVLTSKVAAVRAQEASQKVSVGLRDDAIQPLVIRANEGECVQIRVTNSASGGSFGLHIDGLEFASGSSGDAVGQNAASDIATGGSRTYRFAIPLDRRLEGGHYIHPGPGYRAAVAHGLFGALVVEPPGSTYWNASITGQPLESGWEAIIKPSAPKASCVPSSASPTCAFREAALLHHEIGNDKELLKDAKGLDIPLVDNLTGTYRPGAFALNYRSEPFRNRLLAFPKEKSHAYSSYTFGEPATPMVRGYLADPTKIRLMHVGSEKFHVFHLHGGGDRWRFNPVSDPSYNYADTGLRKDPTTVLSASQRLDSQSIGPGESFNLEIEGGAGGVQQSVGDFLFHCHIAKHYNSGMWGLWRVYDTAQPDFAPLMDRPAPPAAVDSTGLIGKTINGTKITATNLDSWIRPQLPPAGVPRNGQDPTVWNWKVAGSGAKPLYLGAPADPTSFADSPKVLTGQPNLLLVDKNRLVSGKDGTRPTILFNPLNGRPAYPLFRPAIGKRPPFTPAGHTGTPYLGPNANQSSTSMSPWNNRADGLCPAQRHLRTFNVVAIGKTIQRTPTLSDPEGKLFVLAKDKAAVAADPKRSDPLAIRANQGDCVAITLTNEIPDASAFDKFSKTTMHIHHVQFDVQGSDGVSAGFAFEHSVRPYQVEDAQLAAAGAAGSTTLALTDVAKLVGVDANGKATKPFIGVGEGLESIEIHQVVAVNQTSKTVTLDTPLIATHAAGEFAGTEFIQYRWYPDALLDNVFWHDHVDGIHGWGHGLVGQLIVEPFGSTYHDPATGAEVDSGTIVDIHTTTSLAPGLVEGSFRELALWTINDNDAGQYSTLNNRANPLVDRPDTAHQFSSWTYGDPMTPLPRLYPDDPLVVRTINVSPTVDSLHLQGGRTLLEPRQTASSGTGSATPAGSIIDTIHYGVSEKFTLVFNGNAPYMRMRPGDYLYANGVEKHTQQGAWGIVRVLPGTVEDLRPLPGVPTPQAAYTPPVATGGPPPSSLTTETPCPASAPTRRFDLSAVDKSQDLNGGRTAFVPNGDVQAIKNRLKKPVPLVLHVVAGECITVNVTNLLLTPVGFSVGKLDRAAESGGVDVGFAPEQNVAPNATRTYTYYAPTDRVGSAVITDLAAPGSEKNGLYGMVVVAPKSPLDGARTEFSDPVSGLARDIGAQVLVHVPGAAVPDYRDLTVTIADDDEQIGQDFMPYPAGANVGASLVNYQAAPAGDGANAFKDPGQVPLLTAFAGDPELVHVMVAPGSESAHVFSLGGLSWPQDRNIAGSNLVSAQGMAPWESFDLAVEGGAGGTQRAAGDYFYGDLRRPFTAAGVWGLQRVLPVTTTTCPILRVDGSTC